MASAALVGAAVGFVGGLTSMGGGAAAVPGRPPAGTPGRSGGRPVLACAGPGVLLGSALAAAMPKQRLRAVLAEARESLEDLAAARAAASR